MASVTEPFNKRIPGRIEKVTEFRGRFVVKGKCTLQNYVGKVLKKKVNLIFYTQKVVL